ncbi:unnamed protein product, partial [Soboliphyme baturini]|uniref:Small ribosomal subunit protein uS5m n=1 Tax=Soboliphyme baturini TaxID=241478 RepID=A0A183IUH4_9BILA
TGEQLWKSVTSVSSAGRKKGRGRAAKRPRNLNIGQHIGEGPVNTLWPGLNAPIMVGKEMLHRKYIPPNEERETKLLKLREVRTRRTVKVHPLERGWSGRSVEGRKLGPPEIVKDSEDAQNYQSIILENKIVSHMTAKRGRVRRASILAVVGNGNGVAGFSFEKMSDVKSAIRKATNSAAKRLQYIERLNGHTIYQDFWAECYSTKIFARRMPEGYGLRCHRAIKAICELIGIKDMYARTEGNTRNYIALTKALFTGLRDQETHQQLAERKRLYVVEFRKETGYIPTIVAKPLTAPVRTEEEIEANEVLDVEDMYAEGRYPLKKKNRVPFFFHFPSFKKKQLRMRALRNQEDVKIRLLAEGVLEGIDSVTLKRQSEREHERMLQGEVPLPLGIGLTAVTRDSLEEEVSS